MSSQMRTSEIFLECCLEGEVSVVSRILKKHKVKSWPGLMGNNNFDINCLDSSHRSGLIIGTIAGFKDIVDMLLSR